jgi:hypothetical protein
MAALVRGNVQEDGSHAGVGTVNCGFRRFERRQGLTQTSLAQDELDDFE